MGWIMLEELRVIKFQINKNSEWIEIYKTFDDPNVIRSVYYILKNQNNNADLRVLDTNNKIISDFKIKN
jgi:hypothetical protein